MVAGADTGFFSGGSRSERSDRQKGGVWGDPPEKNLNLRGSNIDL